MANVHTNIEYFGNGSFMIPDHDYQSRSGSTDDHGPTEIVYKRGGADGQVVGVETITYDEENHVATRFIEWNPAIVS